MVSPIQFRSLTSLDLPRVQGWLQELHVAQFWRNHGQSWEEIATRYLVRIQSEVVRPYLVLVDGHAIGFIQSSWASRVGEGWWGDVDDHTIALNFYIGDSAYLGRGYGPAILRAFIQKLVAESQVGEIRRFIVDPQPENARAIRTYQRAGFVAQGLVNTPDGLAQLMEIRLPRENYALALAYSQLASTLN